VQYAVAITPAAIGRRRVMATSPCALTNHSVFKAQGLQNFSHDIPRVTARDAAIKEQNSDSSGCSSKISKKSQPLPIRCSARYLSSGLVPAKPAAE
jgi:hypothetical protein